MSTSRHLYHAIWTYKEGSEALDFKYFEMLRQAILQELLALKVRVWRIEILSDHVHVLFEYNGVLGIPGLYKQVKGASSYYLNANDLISPPFYWSKGYESFSVSPNKLLSVVQYLDSQSSFHEEYSIEEEISQIRESAGISGT